MLAYNFGLPAFILAVLANTAADASLQDESATCSLPGYVFLAGAYSPQGSLGSWSVDWSGNGRHWLSERCDSLPNCIAFSDPGELKGYLRPLGNWAWSFDAGDGACYGTYIKEVVAGNFTAGAAAAGRTAALTAAGLMPPATLPLAGPTAAAPASDSSKAPPSSGQGGGQWVGAASNCSDPWFLIPGFKFYPHSFLDQEPLSLAMTGVILDTMTALNYFSFAAECYRCSWCDAFDTTGRIWGDMTHLSEYTDLLRQASRQWAPLDIRHRGVCGGTFLKMQTGDALGCSAQTDFALYPGLYPTTGMPHKSVPEGTTLDELLNTCGSSPETCPAATYPELLLLSRLPSQPLVYGVLPAPAGPCMGTYVRIPAEFRNKAGLYASVISTEQYASSSASELTLNRVRLKFTSNLQLSDTPCGPDDVPCKTLVMVTLTLTSTTTRTAPVVVPASAAGAAAGAPSLSYGTVLFTVERGAGGMVSYAWRLPAPRTTGKVVSQIMLYAVPVRCPLDAIYVSAANAPGFASANAELALNIVVRSPLPAGGESPPLARPAPSAGTGPPHGKESQVRVALLIGTVTGGALALLSVVGVVVVLLLTRRRHKRLHYVKQPAADEGSADALGAAGGEAEGDSGDGPPPGSPGGSGASGPPIASNVGGPAVGLDLAAAAAPTGALLPPRLYGGIYVRDIPAALKAASGAEGVAAGGGGGSSRVSVGAEGGGGGGPRRSLTTGLSDDDPRDRRAIFARLRTRAVSCCLLPVYRTNNRKVTVAPAPSEMVSPTAVLAAAADPAAEDVSPPTLLPPPAESSVAQSRGNESVAATDLRHGSGAAELSSPAAAGAVVMGLESEGDARLLSIVRKCARRSASSPLCTDGSDADDPEVGATLRSGGTRDTSRPPSIAAPGAPDLPGGPCYVRQLLFDCKPNSSARVNTAGTGGAVLASLVDGSTCGQGGYDSATADRTTLRTSDHFIRSSNGFDPGNLKCTSGSVNHSGKGWVQGRHGGRSIPRNVPLSDRSPSPLLQRPGGLSRLGLAVSSASSGHGDSGQPPEARAQQQQAPQQPHQMQQQQPQQPHQQPALPTKAPARLDGDSKMEGHPQSQPQRQHGKEQEAQGQQGSSSRQRCGERQAEPGRELQAGGGEAERADLAWAPSSDQVPADASVEVEGLQERVSTVPGHGEAGCKAVAVTASQACRTSSYGTAGGPDGLQHRCRSSEAQMMPADGTAGAADLDPDPSSMQHLHVQLSRALSQGRVTDLPAGPPGLMWTSTMRGVGDPPSAGGADANTTTVVSSFLTATGGWSLSSYPLLNGESSLLEGSGGGGPPGTGGLSGGREQQQQEQQLQLEESSEGATHARALNAVGQLPEDEILLPQQAETWQSQAAAACDPDYCDPDTHSRAAAVFWAPGTLQPVQVALPNAVNNQLQQQQRRQRPTPPALPAVVVEAATPQLPAGAPAAPSFPPAPLPLLQQQPFRQVLAPIYSDDESSKALPCLSASTTDPGGGGAATAAVLAAALAAGGSDPATPAPVLTTGSDGGGGRFGVYVSSTDTLGTTGASSGGGTMSTGTTIGSAAWRFSHLAGSTSTGTTLRGSTATTLGCGAGQLQQFHLLQPQPQASSTLPNLDPPLSAQQHHQQQQLGDETGGVSGVGGASGTGVMVAGGSGVSSSTREASCNGAGTPTGATSTTAAPDSSGSGGGGIINIRRSVLQQMYGSGTRETEVVASNPLLKVVVGDVPPLEDVDLHIRPQDLELMHLIGKGASGEVYHAVWRGQEVAVKKLVDSCSPHQQTHEVQTLLQEMAILVRARHPNIVRCHGGCLRPPQVFLVEELLVCSLHDFIYHPHSDRSLLKLLGLARDVAMGLAYLHPTILHRDLKPSNILIDVSGRAKIADFGLARYKLHTRLCTNSIEAGTTPYLPPEVFDQRAQHVTDRSDVYSLGMIMWELIVRQPPWHNMRDVAIAYNVHVNRARPALPPRDTCPPRLCRLIQSCWSHRPRDRPSAAEVVKELTLTIMQLEMK